MNNLNWLHTAKLERPPTKVNLPKMCDGRISGNCKANRHGICFTLSCSCDCHPKQDVGKRSKP